MASTLKLTPIKPRAAATIPAAARRLHKLFTENPQRHTAGVYLRGVSGRWVNSPQRAVSCCLLGGMDLFYEGPWEEMTKRVEAACKALYRTTDVVAVNDHEGLPAALRILERLGHEDP